MSVALSPDPHLGMRCPRIPPLIRSTIEYIILIPLGILYTFIRTNFGADPPERTHFLLANTVSWQSDLGEAAEQIEV